MNQKTTSTYAMLKKGLRVIEITKEKIIDLIVTGESETVEFKESFGDEALETIGAFANAKGGILLVGIKDSGDLLG